MPALALAIVLAACGGEDPQKLLGSAKEYLAKHDTKAATIQLKNALKSNPNLPEARYLLGKTLMQEGNFAGAEVEFRKALELNFAKDQVVPLLAQSLAFRGQAKKVVEEFANVSLTDPAASADLLTIVSMSHGALGKPDLAKAALEKALAVQPENPAALLMSARVKASEKDVEGAIAVVDGILAKHASDPEAIKFKGDLLMRKGQVNEGLEQYRKAIAANGKFIPAHIALTTSLIHLGKADEATAALGQFKQIAPKHPQILMFDAELAFARKDLKQAKEFISQYHKVVQANPLSNQLAGVVEYGLGNFAQAEDYLVKALADGAEVPLAQRMLISAYLKMGQGDKALETIKPLLPKIENSPAMLSLAGLVFLQQKDYKKSEEYFGKAAKLDPNDPAKRTRLAMVRLAEGDTGAFADLEAVAADDTGTSADMALIASHLRRNEPDKALKAVEGLEKKRPNDAAVFTMRGEILIAMKNREGARAAFEKALSIKASHYPAAAKLAELDVQAGKLDDAKRRFESVIAADPKNVQAYLALAGIVSGSGGNLDEVVALIGKAIAANPSDVKARVALVEANLRGKEPKKALAAAQDALAALPDSAALVDVLAQAQFAAGDRNQALVTYGKLSALQPKSPLPFYKMAEVNAVSKDTEEAIRNLRKALGIQPDFLEGQRALIALYLGGGRFREAQAIAQDVQKQRPKEAHGYGFAGDIAASQKQWPEAIKAYRTGLERVPAAEILAIKLLAALDASGNKADADRFSASWLKDHPKDAAFRSFMAEQLGRQQNWAGAVQQYRIILEQQPNNPAVMNNLAWAMGKAKDPKALEIAEKANTLAPNQPVVMDTLASLLMEKGEVGRAKDLLKKAVEIGNAKPDIRLNYARVLVQAGDKAEAKVQLDILSKLGDAYPGKDEVAKLLKQI